MLEQRLTEEAEARFFFFLFKRQKTAGKFEGDFLKKKGKGDR